MVAYWAALSAEHLVGSTADMRAAWSADCSAARSVVPKVENWAVSSAARRASRKVGHLVAQLAVQLDPKMAVPLVVMWAAW